MKRFAEGQDEDLRGSGRDGKQGGRSSAKRQRTQTQASKANDVLEYERIEMATTCLLNCFTFDNAATTANVKDYGAFFSVFFFSFFFLFFS
jgi:hypothetical protein